MAASTPPRSTEAPSTSPRLRWYRRARPGLIDILTGLAGHLDHDARIAHGDHALGQGNHLASPEREAANDVVAYGMRRRCVLGSRGVGQRRVIRCGGRRHALRPLWGPGAMLCVWAPHAARKKPNRRFSCSIRIPVPLSGRANGRTLLRLLRIHELYDMG